MVCQRCNKPSSDSDRCSTCGAPLKTLQSQQRRGWVAFGGGVFIVLFMGAIWIWVDQLVATKAQGDVATAQFLGPLNVAFALVVIAGILGVVNGWVMARTGVRNRALIFGLLIAFVSALFVAFTASNGYHGS